MKKILTQKTFLIFSFILFISSLSPASLFAAGHGCATNEPDRDGDGVPDKDDSFPDDPSQYKQDEEAGPQDRFCGPVPVKMKLYFVPFNASGIEAVTKESIEQQRVNALWFCAKNDMSDTLQNILDKNKGAAGEAVSDSQKDALKTGSEDPINLAPDSEKEKAAAVMNENAASDEEDFDKLFGDKEIAGESGKTSELRDAHFESSADDSEFPLGILTQDQIRLKIEVPQSSSKEITYLVDKFGEGTKNGEPFHLTTPEMNAIQKMVESVSGMVDLNIKPSCQDDQWKSAPKDIPEVPI